MQLTNLSIAQSAKLFPITEIAEKLHINRHNLIQYGDYVAKVHINQFSELGRQNGKLILVTSITPTKEGEGKTTATIGIAQALARIGKKSMICIRQPSLGPVFGIKGGACGGGFSQVLPMEDINLHFTGDIHAISTSANLLSALLDNSITNDNLLNIDVDNIIWKRTIDMNDRSLRRIIVGCSGMLPEKVTRADYLRSDSFEITAASEVMAILSLAQGYTDLKCRLGKIIVGFNKDKKPVTASDLSIDGAMTAVLKNALHPNLVQSVEHVPAFVHGGAFGNVAHGCNSLIATKMALRLADYVVTEAGFGADLGCEKFFDIKCRTGNLMPSAVVIVATVKALKMHGAGRDYTAVDKGFENLEKQIENVRKFGIVPIVAINSFPDDKEQEFESIIKKCNELKISAYVIDVWGKGGNGAIHLAEELVRTCLVPNDFRFLYDDMLPIKEKVGNITRDMYGAVGVNYTNSALSDIELIEKSRLDNLLICIAKTQKSLSDNPNLLGRPRNFEVTVTRLKVSAGAGFIVVYLGDILTMPGLPKVPAALSIDIDENGVVKGLF